MHYGKAYVFVTSKRDEMINKITSYIPLLLPRMGPIFVTKILRIFMPNWRCHLEKSGMTFFCTLMVFFRTQKIYENAEAPIFHHIDVTTTNTSVVSMIVCASVIRFILMVICKRERSIILRLLAKEEMLDAIGDLIELFGELKKGFDTYINVTSIFVSNFVKVTCNHIDKN